MTNKAPRYVEGHQLLAGKSVLITAAAGAGIGFSAAQRAVEEGASAVVISDIHDGRLEQAVETLSALSPNTNVHGIRADVTLEAEVQHLVSTADDRVDGVDILINNAGLGGTRLLVDMTDEEWSRVLDITLTGTMRMTRHMMKVMRDRGNGGGQRGRHAVDHQAHAGGGNRILQYVRGADQGDGQ